MSVKTTYQRRKEAGICTRCGAKSVVEGKKQCQECLDYCAERGGEYRVKCKEAGVCWVCGVRNPVEGKSKCQECTDHTARCDADRNAKSKEAVLKHYSGSDVPYCACCGETASEFLTIDHIDGNGAEHRRKNGYGTGWHTYYWLIQNNYPDGFRVLCFNCNSARGFFGYCPHEKQREIDNEAVIAKININHAKIPVPTALPTPRYEQLALDGGHFNILR